MVVLFLIAVGCARKKEQTVYSDKFHFDNMSITVKLPFPHVTRWAHDTTAYRFVRKNTTYRIDSLLDIEFICTKYLKDKPKPLLEYFEDVLSIYDDQWRKYCVDTVMSVQDNGVEKLYYEIAVEDFKMEKGYDQRKLNYRHVYSYQKDSTVVNTIIRVHTNRPYQVKSIIDEIERGIDVSAAD